MCNVIKRIVPLYHSSLTFNTLLPNTHKCIHVYFVHYYNFPSLKASR
uniref:Uncharacterized protein n=1 Tax=Anguilla anguilla TaxID=7936 RepID=A0A0E9T722_ANGAN